MARPPSARSRRIRSLLDLAGIASAIEDVAELGIGTAGLAARGMRDEDGIHARVQLGDGSSVLYREYTPNAMAAAYQAKETAVFEALRARGLPTPAVLASLRARGSASAKGEPGALLLSDDGGSPLEEVFRSIVAIDREGLWVSVGSFVRRLHALDLSVASGFSQYLFPRPWTRFVPYFAKSLSSVKKTVPELTPAVDEALSLIPALARWYDARPRSICFSLGHYLPGMLVAPADDGPGWAVSSWLSLGYYVSISDPARDVVTMGLSHREWTGDELPAAFYDAYGSRPDLLSVLIYESWMQLGRGASYVRGKRRPGWGPPPHSAAVAALDDLPRTVERLRSMLT